MTRGDRRGPPHDSISRRRSSKSLVKSSDRLLLDGRQQLVAISDQAPTKASASASSLTATTRSMSRVKRGSVRTDTAKPPTSATSIAWRCAWANTTRHAAARSLKERSRRRRDLAHPSGGHAARHRGGRQSARRTHRVTTADVLAHECDAILREPQRLPETLRHCWIRHTPSLTGTRENGLLPNGRPGRVAGAGFEPATFG